MMNNSLRQFIKNKKKQSTRRRDIVPDAISSIVKEKKVDQTTLNELQDKIIECTKALDSTEKKLYPILKPRNHSDKPLKANKTTTTNTLSNSLEKLRSDISHLNSRIN